MPFGRDRKDVVKRSCRVLSKVTYVNQSYEQLLCLMYVYIFVYYSDNIVWCCVGYIGWAVFNESELFYRMVPQNFEAMLYLYPGLTTNYISKKNLFIFLFVFSGIAVFHGLASTWHLVAILQHCCWKSMSYYNGFHILWIRFLWDQGPLLLIWITTLIMDK